MEDQQKWEGLFRGSVLSTTIQKHVAYITSAHQHAQGLIVLNAALVPLAITGMAPPHLRTASLLCILTALITITLCIFCLYPKGLRSKSGRVNLLHYKEFSSLAEFDYLDRMRELLSDKEKLAEAVVFDLWHLGHRIVAPKFVILRVSYVVFLVGQLTAALLAISNV